MISERMKSVLERTEKALCKHLECLNDDIERAGGIDDHMIIDDIKDCLKSLKIKNEIMKATV